MSVPYVEGLLTADQVADTAAAIAATATVRRAREVVRMGMPFEV